ncbi:tRNA (adenosine(37)-N6)-threonylcarbamoyltransferase complex ATPase subunit type 1 TsaE [Alicyclobacillus fastidiosus]|uniref:tRNA threonylcarbamoyladenosine biosynthesis protein TsaE n=1 Tax=Alicyclobacillus fastidiosus TaxID=392011 RepID=A0ABY6ZFN0_9BACL|nr:tRNA (adenosine(37)-N6)-threonylcarbamoyltransferase complex ATPase subunit type 1 TsaE [Alicyclobacillus fastidiosus]WAH41664.1 tRNA (adenosine(37)-N6)-threonylcarbamoyltransferase complex ATPase subunit type 1 TsaE [Alicyclobacillus fastidiosus]GMA63342.1 tRNA (adenosine(37)-N6)-threonylcarbamoyltransferase complex ATPase subunit type 1 TsaE [Alicyclobacillus fastidiosus]
MLRDWLVTTSQPEETQRLGACLGNFLQAGDVVLLYGPLGAGKTHFAQGVARGLRVESPVTSPTFTLVAEYEGRVPLIHMDLYRLYDDAEASEPILTPESLVQIGFDDYLDGDGVVLIEWGRGVEADLDNYLSVSIDYAKFDEPSDDGVTTRQIAVEAIGEMAQRRLWEWVVAWA